MTNRKPWRFSIETPRPKLTIKERPDRDWVCYVYWWNPSRGKKGVVDKISVRLIVRRPDGRLDPDLVKAAQARAESYHRLLTEGIDPREARARAHATDERGDPERLTIAEGFDLYFDSTKGAYGADTRDLRTLKNTYRPLVEQVFGHDLPWARLDADAGVILSRALAAHYPGGSGFRSAVRVVDMVFRAADWLRVRKRIPTDACMRPREWAEKMREEWSKAGKDVEPSQPRYTRREIPLLFGGADKADPRIRMALTIGPELRAVNLRSIRRTDVNLDSVGDWGLGRIRVPGSTKKRGAMVDIDPALRELLDFEMFEGYLARFERRFGAREIPDYPLLPGQGLSGLSRRRFRELFDAYEKDCGVEHKPGRGWHGLRRALSDALAEQTEDEHVRDHAGGWQLGSDTRSRTYTDGQNPRLLAKTRHEVLKTRRTLMGSDAKTEELRQEVLKLLWDAPEDVLKEALEALRKPRLTPVLTPAEN